MTFRKVLPLASAVMLAFPCHAQGRVRPMLATDPNRDPGWDWTAHTTHTLYHAEAGGRPVAATVKLPYDTPDNPLYAETPDLHREDGWMLVHRDFGTPEAAPPLPYFTLYNRHRGIFRVMVYNAKAREGSYYVGELSFLDGGRGQDRAAGLLTFQAGERSSLADYDPGQRELVTSRMKPYDDWGVFDFPLVGFDPSLEAKDPILVFKLTGVATSRLSLNGKGDLDLIQENLGSKMAPGASVSGGGSIWKTMGETGYRCYRDLRAWVEDFCHERNRDRNRKFPFYNEILRLSQSRIASFAPYAGALMGVLDGFLGGVKRAAPWEPMSFKGQTAFQVEGGLDASRELWATAFYLRPGPPHLRAQRPVQAIPWGLFNLDAPFRVDFAQGANPALKTWRITGGGNLLLNPALGMTLESVDYAFEYKVPPLGKTGGDAASWAPAGLSPFRTREALASQGETVKAQLAATGVLVQMRFRTLEPTLVMDNEVLVIKRYPVSAPQLSSGLSSLSAKR